MRKRLVLILIILFMVGCAGPIERSDNDGKISKVLVGLFTGKNQFRTEETNEVDSLSTKPTAVPVPTPEAILITAPTPTPTVKPTHTEKPSPTLSLTASPKTSPIPRPTTSPKPTIMPKPAAAPMPTTEPVNLEAFAKDVMQQVNAARTIKLAWHNGLESIAKERAKKVSDSGSITLDSPAAQMETAKIFFSTCTYGQSYYEGRTPRDLSVDEMIQSFQKALKDEKYNSVGIGLYATDKAVSLTFIVAEIYTSASSFLSSVEQEILALTNQERRKVGLADLSWHNAAHKVARDKVLEMYDKNYFAHTSPYTGELQQQFEVFGGLILGSNVSTIGENLAMVQGYSQDKLSAAFWVQQWMDSPGHKANIVNKDFTHMGVGVYYGQDGRAYASQAFCTPK